jgi:hypothetical protein
MAEGFRKKAEALRRLAKDILDTELTPAQKAAAEAAEQEGAEAEIVPPVVDTPHDMPTGTAPIDRAHDENEARRAAQADLAEATRAAAALEPIAPPTAAPEPVVEDEKTERNTRKPIRRVRRKKSDGPTKATLDGAMRYTADKARFGREMVEACGRLKERIDKQSIVIMEQLNTALTSAADGRAYSFDATTGKISANPQTPDLVTGYINTEEVVRELEALVRDIPREIETLFHTLDESHAEFVGIMNGEPETATRRTFAEVPKVESKPLDTIAGGTPSPIKTSLEAALLASADRTAFLKELVEASNRLKKQIDEKVVSLLMMMKSALATGVDDIAFTQNESTDAITPVPPPDDHITNQVIKL